MLKDDAKLFKPWLRRYDDNEFAAVLAIAKQARMLAETTDNIINHSEALTWALTDETPEILEDQERAKIYHKSYIRNYLRNQLSLIDDEFVKLSVKESFKASLKAHTPVYQYVNVIEEPRRARIRVLINMLWHKLQEFKEEQ